MSEFDDSEADAATGSADPVVATMSRPKGKTSEQTETRREPPYNVIILNDEEHTFDYVIEVLCKIFRHPTATAEELTWRIHNTGRAIVYTTHKEHAELKRDQVLEYGADPRMDISTGSLRCHIEPAEAGD
jgi:ATP-dependent Clp protease adaptor protein ClpS